MSLLQERGYESTPPSLVQYRTHPLTRVAPSVYPLVLPRRVSTEGRSDGVPTLILPLIFPQGPTVGHVNPSLTSLSLNPRYPSSYTGPNSVKLGS